MSKVLKYGHYIYIYTGEKEFSRSTVGKKTQKYKHGCGPSWGAKSFVWRERRLPSFIQ